MNGDYATQGEGYGDRFFAEINTRIRDIEEKQRLLKDRMILVTESFVKEREKNFIEVEEMKKTLEKLKSDNDMIKSLLRGMGERINSSARKEDIMIMQRQLELLRDN